MYEGQCFGYLITEKTPNGIINNVACTDYEIKPLRNTTAVLLWSAASEWVERGVSKSTVVNRGAAVRGAGSKIAKEKLRPIKAHQNYKFNVEKLSKEDYNSLWTPEEEPIEWL